MNTVLVEIPTKNRKRTLARCLAALLSQTFQEYDLLIVNDNPSDKLTDDAAFAQWLKRHQRIRHVYLEDGLGIGQTYAHNLALWHKPWRDYEYILRLDDDVLLNSLALEHMVRAIDDDPNIAAVTGLWFENEQNEDWHSDRDVPNAEEWDELPELDGKADVEGVVSNWHQRLYHDMRRDGDAIGAPMRVEHCYGSMLYRADDMRRAGGWPEIYSQGVHHGEETDGSYRLHLLGKQMWLVPSVTGQHLRDQGGIRSLGIDLEQQTRLLDDPLRNRRLQAMPGVYDRKLKVGVWSQHAYYTGGGPHEYFRTIEALQKSPYIDVWALDEHMTPEQAARDYGIKPRLNRKKEPEHFDVIVKMADDLDWFDECSDKRYEADAEVLYVFYPFGDRAPQADEFTTIVANSKFGARAVEKKWGWQSGHIYPLVQPVRRLKKQNWILLPGRIDQWKGTLWLMQLFVELEVEDWELHVVGATQGSIQHDYIDQVEEFAEGHDNIHIHYDASHEELAKFYGRGKIMWAAKGMLADESGHDEEAEHFGIPPVQAITASCVPLVYDMGGHQETVPAGWRWKTREELVEKTRQIMDGDGQVFPDVSNFCDLERYAQHWERLVLQANVRATKLLPVDKTRIEVVAKKPVLAIVSDSPALPKELQQRSPRIYTGFGVVAGQIVPAFLDDFEIVYYAILDSEDAWPGEFPWRHCRMERDDLQGRKNIIEFMRRNKPDVLWTLYDPSNVFSYLIFNEYGLQATRDHTRIPVVAYFPIEGSPIPDVTGRMVNWIKRSGGSAFTYSQGSADLFEEEFGEEVGYANHGLDHADFRPYEPDEREAVRKLVGLDDIFLVGAFGINKRTKQHDLLVYAACYLVEWGYKDKIKFYIHTEPGNPILNGYHLDWMVEWYNDPRRYLGIEDMFIWKPDSFEQRGGQYRGADYEVDTCEWASRLTMPPTRRGRELLFGSYDIVSRYNCLDLYVDCSSVEGWNLPLGEAMKCGVPCITVRDGLVREEIYGEGAYMLDPSPIPTTWHNVTKLQIVDPEDIAKAIVAFYEDSALRKRYSEYGLEVAGRYTWQPCRDVMLQAVKDAVGI